MVTMLPFVKRLIRHQSFSMVFSPLPLRFMSTTTNQIIEKLDEKKFNEATNQLEKLITDFRNFSPRAGLFSPEIELNDEITNKQIKGLVDYQTHAIKYQFYINWKYNAFKIQPVETIKNLDQGIVDIRWQMYGKPGWILTFVVDLAKLASTTATERKDDYEAMEGLSTFHLDKDARIYKQTLKLLKRGNYRDIIRLPKK